MNEAAKLTDDQYSISLEDINVRDPNLFVNANHWGYFERLRKEDLIHFWKEILKRFNRIEVVKESRRTQSCFVKGYTDLVVVVTAR
jgi:hypothetical protein